MFFFESRGTGTDSEASFFFGTEPAPEIVEPPKPSTRKLDYNLLFPGPLKYDITTTRPFSLRTITVQYSKNGAYWVEKCALQLWKNYRNLIYTEYALYTNW